MNERGSATVLGWMVVLPLLLFFLLVASTWLNLDRQKGGAAMAAMSSARTYGIQLGKDPSTADNRAEIRARQILQEYTIISPGGDFITSPPAQGQRGAAINLSNDGKLARVVITCYVPNPFPRVTRLIHDNTAAPNHFVFQAKGVSKYEDHP